MPKSRLVEIVGVLAGVPGSENLVEKVELVRRPEKLGEEKVSELYMRAFRSDKQNVDYV